MSVSEQDVEHVASLARLSFSPQEKRKLAEELNEILRYMEQLNKLDTTHIEPLSQVVELSNVLRNDMLKPSLPRRSVLQNAPAKTEQFFKVPKVIGER
jgi:aspartyl-tRNA(Asn)/glutamyl-tRNA(Gln) amidotransferase subunit C